MPSLPWILLLALAALHTLMAAPITEDQDRTRLQHHSKRIIHEIKTMKAYNCIDPTAVFYSPPGDSIECIKADLACFRDELTTVEHECFDRQQSSLQAFDNIKDSLDWMNKIFEKASSSQNQSMDCTCEIHPQKNYMEFLLSLEQRIQKMNSQL